MCVEMIVILESATGKGCIVDTFIPLSELRIKSQHVSKVAPLWGLTIVH